jgi:hypothetical protein
VEFFIAYHEHPFVATLLKVRLRLVVDFAHFVRKCLAGAQVVSMMRACLLLCLLSVAAAATTKHQPLEPLTKFRAAAFIQCCSCQACVVPFAARSNAQENNRW